MKKLIKEKWITYDEFGINEWGSLKVTPKIIKLVKDLDRKLIQVRCVNQQLHKKFYGVSFFAIPYVVPRIGETIALEDGTICKIFDIVYMQISMKKKKRIKRIFLSIPIIYAMKNLENVYIDYKSKNNN